MSDNSGNVCPIEGTVYEKELRDKAIQIVDDALDEEYHKGRADEREKVIAEVVAEIREQFGQFGIVRDVLIRHIEKHFNTRKGED